MSKVWQTQYGPRRVKYDLPTLDDAIFAAQGLTEDVEEQAEIAASLMGVEIDEVKTRLAKVARLAGRRPAPAAKMMTTGRNHVRAVVVERRPIARSLTRRFSS